MIFRPAVLALHLFHGFLHSECALTLYSCCCVLARWALHGLVSVNRHIPSLMAFTRLLKTHVLCRGTVIICLKLAFSPQPLLYTGMFSWWLIPWSALLVAVIKLKFVNRQAASLCWLLWWSLPGLKMFSSIAIRFNYMSILNNDAMMLAMLLIRQQGTCIWKILINQLKTKSFFILHK